MIVASFFSAESCLGKSSQYFFIGQFNQKNDIWNVIDEFMRIAWRQFVKLEDEFGLLDWKLFDSFDFIKQKAFGLIVEETAFSKDFI